jgi:hypothetical protein
VHVPGGAKDLTDYAKGGGDVSAWLRSLIDRRPAWAPPADEDERNQALSSLEAAIAGGQLGADDEARAIARFQCCRGVETTSDSQEWINLAT